MDDLFVPVGTGHSIRGNYTTIPPVRRSKAQLCNSNDESSVASAQFRYPGCRRARISAASARVTLRCEAMAALSISATMVAAASMDRSMCRAMWPITCGSTTSCRSMKCLTSTALSRASSGGAMVTKRQRPQTRSEIGQADVELAGRHARGEQHRQLVLAHQVEQVKQGALVADAGMEVLDQHGAAGRGRLHVRLAQSTGLQPRRARLQPPHVGKVRLAGARRRHDQNRGLRPIRPAVDDVGGRTVGLADEKILRPQRRPVRKIKNKLTRYSAQGVSPERIASRLARRTRPCRRSCPDTHRRQSAPARQWLPPEAPPPACPPGRTGS